MPFVPAFISEGSVSYHVGQVLLVVAGFLLSKCDEFRKTFEMRRKGRGARRLFWVKLALGLVIILGSFIVRDVFY